MDTDLSGECIKFTKDEFIDIAVKAGQAVAKKILSDINAQKKKETEAYSPIKATKSILGEYRLMKKVQKTKEFLPSHGEVNELYWRFLEELMGKPEEKRIMEDVAYVISKKHLYNSYKVWRVETAIDFFKEECKSQKTKEALRRYRIIRMMYIDNDRKTIGDIAKQEGVSEKTVYKDIDIACNAIAVYLASI